VRNIAGSSVDIEQLTPLSTSCGSGWSASDATAPVRRLEIGGDVKYYSARGYLARQGWILRGCDAVPDPACGQQTEGRPHRLKIAELTCVRYRGEAAVSGHREGRA
jgi:hypothetical protein